MQSFFFTPLFIYIKYDILKVIINDDSNEIYSSALSLILPFIIKIIIFIITNFSFMSNILEMKKKTYLF